MSWKSIFPVNDFNHCVQQAQTLTRNMQNKRCRDRSLCRAFSQLAGDELTGLLAFAIWRGRSQLFTNLQTAPGRGTLGENTSRASHAQSYWKGERVATGNLPNRQRPDLQRGK